jgi:4a-hydroxytetrahydrobiopterin dehydratase
MDTLRRKSCKPLPAGTPPLTPAEVNAGLARLEGWEFRDGAICKRFSFTDFSATMAFVNKLAQIAAREDHHPEMLVDFASCRVAYSTHSVGGISENDFICAAKIEALCAN